MHVLVVYAHPDPESFSARLRDTVLAALERAGHEVELLDLYAEGFDPVLGAEAWAPAGALADPALARHHALLARAEALVLVHPTWWSGHPAILKGWFDRVLCDGVAYTRRPGRRRRRGQLRGLRRLVVVTTHGSPRRINLLQGESGRKLVMRSLHPLAHPLARRRWLAYYGIDEDDPVRREAFVARVAAAMAQL